MVPNEIRLPPVGHYAELEKPIPGLAQPHGGSALEDGSPTKTSAFDARREPHYLPHRGSKRFECQVRIGSNTTGQHHEVDVDHREIGRAHV